MIDLHIHSNCSDGSDGVLDILRQAELLGLECISITDHNTCKGYETIKNVNLEEYFKGRLITGCEISCIHDNIPIEVLGFNIDADIISEWLNIYFSDQAVLKIQNKHLEEQKKVCSRLGLHYDLDLCIMDPKKFYSTVMGLELSKHESNRGRIPEEVWGNPTLFFRLCSCNVESPFYVDESGDKPSLQEAVKAIKDSGGISFLAHLFMYSADDKERFLNSVVSSSDIDGVECFYSAFSQKQTEFLIEFCKKNNLFMSGGSDYHGTLKPDISLGIGRGELNIPYNIIKNWSGI